MTARRRPRGVARALVALVGVGAIAASLAACTNPLSPVAGGRFAPAEEPQPVTDGVPDELLPFYDQQPEWGACDDAEGEVDLQCATIEAPLDWHDPQAGEIELAVVRPADLPADPVGSLLVNPGGPGGSGVDYVAQSLQYDGISEELLGSFRVVGFDPRGVGDSTAVECLGADEMDEFLYGIPAGARGSDEWDESVDAANAVFAEACDENSGDLLEVITTEQSARDMDLLRAVLGDEQLHYLGYSYGTFLGATYAELFPDRAGRLVLDGALDPSAPASEVGSAQAAGFEASLRAYLESCLGGSACPFRGTADQALGELSALLAETDARPMPTADGRELGGDALMTGILAALYSTENWPILTEGLAGALEGDPSTMMFLADFYNGREPDGTYGDNSTEAFHAYNCMDYPPEDDDVWEDIEERMQGDAATLWEYMVGPDLCEHWAFPPSGEREPITAEGAAPILVVGTTGDPATPFAWAEALADQLSSGVLLAYEGEGHTAYGGGDACVDGAVESFLIDGEVPEDGLTCGGD
ncbi:alpha/beta hydrolase [Microbacterium sp. gxy059]|uniref:alpha/beta hydrolase n=1 Tax=Microbacterium sp. gxy059 TaxID=2957199 RepID=UPI003D9A0863